MFISSKGDACSQPLCLNASSEGTSQDLSLCTTLLSLQHNSSDTTTHREGGGMEVAGTQLCSAMIAMGGPFREAFAHDLSSFRWDFFLQETMWVSAVTGFLCDWCCLAVQ